MNTLHFIQDNLIMIISFAIVMIIAMSITGVIVSDYVKGKITEEMILQAHYGYSITLRGKDHVRTYKLIAASELAELRKRAENTAPIPWSV